MQRNLRAHLFNGNTDSDSDWKEFYSPPRSHFKKKVRGRRWRAGARNTIPSPPPLPVSPLPRRKRRVFVSNIIKVRAVDEYENLLAASSPLEAAHSFKMIFPSISLTNVFRWRRKITTLREDVNNSQFRRIAVSSAAVAVRSEAWFPEAEKCVFALFEESRETGLPCSTMWFSATMKKELLRLYPGRQADDFVAGAGWFRGFLKRFGLSSRIATNIMPQSAKERIPLCLSFYETIQKFCADEGKMNYTWGRFTPDHR